MLSSFLAIILVFGGIPALAAEAPLSDVQVIASSSSSEFDFSGTDDIDKFDSYEVKTDETGTDYVVASAVHHIDTISPVSIDSTRYGAFLRYQGEIQKYKFYNIPPSSSAMIVSNVLTVYADPETQFSVMTNDEQIIANSEGEYTSSKVKYYKKSTEGNKNVYYIELFPAELGLASHYFIQFTTESTTVQPHYSFWFGNPLTRIATANCAVFNIPITYPSTSAVKTVTSTNLVPERSWISKVMITRTSAIGANNVTRGSFTVTLPNNKKQVNQLIKLPTTTINVGLNYVNASPVKGTFTLEMNKVGWATGVKTGAQYTYMGQLSVEYYYAFGA